MSNTFFTSDTHFNHSKPFIYEARGFKDINEMNECIIERWNSIVKDTDTVYLLGDVFLGKDFEHGLHLVSLLKGNIYVAFGNHDTNNRIKLLQQLKNIKDIRMGYRLSYRKKSLIATHYPTLTDNMSPDHVISLYGHTHQTVNFNEQIRYGYHVGVDSHKCYPVALEDIIKEMKEHQYGTTQK